MLLAVLLGASVAAILLILAIAIRWRWEMKHEEMPEDWAPNELPTMILATQAEARLDDTGLLDMSWMLLHGDMGDIEDKFHHELTKLIDEAIFVLMDDMEWDRYGEYLKERQSCESA